VLAPLWLLLAAGCFWLLAAAGCLLLLRSNFDMATTTHKLQVIRVRIRVRVKLQ
jgi:hypothetical protein